MRLLFPRSYTRLTVVPLGIFSAVLLVFPAAVSGLLNLPPTQEGNMMLQFLGASLAGHAYLNAQAFRYKDAELRIVMRMNMVALSLAAVVSVGWMLAGYVTLTGTLILLMHLLFLGGFFVSYRRWNAGLLGFSSSAVE